MGAQARRQSLLKLLAPAVFRDEDVIPWVLEDIVSCAEQAVGISHKRDLCVCLTSGPKLSSSLSPTYLVATNFARNAMLVRMYLQECCRWES